MNKALLKKYAKIVTTVGANVGKDDDVLINSSLEGVPLSRLICEECYKAGARRVHVNYNDRAVSRLKFLNENIETLADIRPFVADMKNSYDAPTAWSSKYFPTTRTCTTASSRASWRNIPRRRTRLSNAITTAR